VAAKKRHRKPQWLTGFTCQKQIKTLVPSSRDIRSCDVKPQENTSFLHFKPVLKSAHILITLRVFDHQESMAFEPLTIEQLRKQVSPSVVLSCQYQG
jgi:hypothetical protein